MFSKTPENVPSIYKIAVLFTLITVLIYINTASGNPKIDCQPLAGSSEKKCLELGCVWQPVAPQSQNDIKPFGQELPWTDTSTPINLRNVEPFCTYPSNYIGYKVLNLDEYGKKAHLTRSNPSGVPDDIKNIAVTIEELGTATRIRIVDADNQRFERPIPVLNGFNKHTNGRKNQENDLRALVDSNGRLSVTRYSTRAVIFETDLTKLIFADKFAQLNSKLASPFVYGLGEHYDTFLKFANAYKPYSFFHTDHLPLPGGTRSYSSFPFYVNLDSPNQTHAHGVYLHNSNAMDIILQPDPSVTFRPTGGVLDFIIFDGPSPNDVIMEYQNTVGLPDLPPIWALGFHLCRFDYNSSARTQEINLRNRKAGVPVEVQWNDVDYMHRRNDFSIEQKYYAGLPAFVDSLHKDNLHYIPLIDPGLSQEDNYYPYKLGKDMDIFIKNATNQILVGKVWNYSGRTVFPDFSNPKSVEYWSKLFVEFHKELKFDGAWIDMNDISSFVDGSLDGCPMDDPYENPIYLPENKPLQFHSLCMTARMRAGIFYNVHNLYSFYETIATHKALLAARHNQRSLIISRSSTVGQGSFGGHWNGDLASNWDYLRWTIPSLIEHSMYGYTMMGADICGFGGNTNPELCARWSTLGAFYTFSRNHNEDTTIDQDPVALGQDVVDANKNAYRRKYSLLPFAYTLITEASTYGTPVVRSVPFVFFGDKQALHVEYQFMWGDILMISPIVEPNSYVKETYLPAGRWFETNILPDNMHVPKMIDSPGMWYKSTNVSLSNMIIFHRGGYIVPIYTMPKQSIFETVNSPFGLEVALDSTMRATGKLYMADGYKIDGEYKKALFHVENNKLHIHTESNFNGPFDEIRVMPVTDKVKEIKVQGSNSVTSSQVSDMIRFEQNGHLLKVRLNNMVMNGSDLTIEWS